MFARLGLSMFFVLLALFVVVSGCTSVFFHPMPEEVWTPALDNISYKDIEFESSDGVSLHGWLMCPQNRTPRGTILFLHGNAENISTHARATLWLVKEGYEVFAFDYRGYGRSAGKPDLPGVHRDALAAVDKLLSMPGVSPERYVVLGQSLGGSIAVHTVAKTPLDQRPRALIIDSAFAGYRKIVRDKLSDFWFTWPLAWPVSLFYGDEYSASRWVDKAGPGPVIVIHGTKDGIVPYGHGVMLYELAKDPKGFWTNEDGGHIMALWNPPIRKYFLDFLGEWITPGEQGACSP
ncbi:MAG: alpha/beta fold hydrolase [Syntrophorhabdaceae bacterium]|nr:alpha/beta fold hydrolase [Syntrophorhabdaceae bacterium]